MTAARRRVGQKVGVRKGVDLKGVVAANVDLVPALADRKDAPDPTDLRPVADRKDVDLMTEALGVARLGRQWAVAETMMTTTMMIGRIVGVAVRQPADRVPDRAVRDACPDSAARRVDLVGVRKGLAECLDSAALLDLAALAADLELAGRALVDAEVTASMAASPTWNAGSALLKARFAPCEVSGAADLKAIVATRHAVSAVRTATAGRRMASAVLKRAAPKVARVLKTGAVLKAGRAPTAVVPKAVRGPRVVRVAKVVGRKAGPAQRVVVQKLVARKAVVRKVVDQTGAAAKAVPVPMAGLVLMGVLTPKAAVHVVLAFLRDHSVGPDRVDLLAAPAAVDLLAAHRTVKAAAIAWN